MKTSGGFAPIFILILVLFVVGAVFVWSEVSKPLNILQPSFSPQTLPSMSPTSRPIISVICTPDPVESKQKQVEEIMATFSNETNIVSVTNQIDNFAVLDEHGRPPNYHGGGWCVVKKECGKWVDVFCSQDETWCSLYQQYDLPAGLLGNCVNPSPNTSQ